MKKFVSTLLFFLLFFAFSTHSYAVVAPAPESGATSPRQERLEKRMQKMQDKLEKKIAKKQKKAPAPQIWDDGRFRLGIFAFAVALGLALISALGILSGFFGFLAGIAALAGLVLVIWALVDYSY